MKIPKKRTVTYTNITQLHKKIHDLEVKNKESKDKIKKLKDKNKKLKDKNEELKNNVNKKVMYKRTFTNDYQVPYEYNSREFSDDEGAITLGQW